MRKVVHNGQIYHYAKFANFWIWESSKFGFTRLEKFLDNWKSIVRN
jgi:hypothetical protein